MGNPQERPQHSCPTIAEQLGVSEYVIRMRAYNDLVVPYKNYGLTLRE